MRMSCFWSRGCMFQPRMAAAAHPITPPPPLQPAPPPNTAPAVETTLVPSESHASSGRALDPESVVSRLPVEVEVGVPVRDFRVRNLLALEPGVIVGSQWGHGDDLPLSAGEVQLAWIEFEVVVNSLSARITRIA
jgi:Type III flagellar switch regulator (C-ring) FliN C-term